MRRSAVLNAAAVVVAAGSLMVIAAGDGGPCGGLEEIELPDGQVLCTHGPDEGLATADTDQPYAGAPNSPLPTAPVQCYDDGRSGARVEVLSLSADGTAAGTADIRRWVGQVEWTFNQSAARDGGRRHVRWVTQAAAGGGCQVAVTPVQVPPEALVDFPSTVSTLAELGYTRSDRKYLLFTATSQGLCGIGTAPNDDRASADNRSNVAVGYARVDSDCWATADTGHYSVAAHELTHTLGAVQASAPHVTTNRHCTDEWDLMCYDDGSGQGTTVRCEDDYDTSVAEADLNNRLLDCGRDDYFNAGRPTGYLADHWNVAASIFLSTAPGTEAGWSSEPTVASDPQGRPVRWSGRLGVHRPVLTDAFGWESCELPVTLALVEDDAGGLLGGVLGGTTGSSALRDAVVEAADWVNAAVGRQVVVVDPSGESGSQGVAVIDTSTIEDGTGQLAPTKVTLTIRDSRIRSGAITIDETAATEGGRLEVWVAQAITQVLGVGREGSVGSLMSLWPTPQADRSVAGKALRHLYGDGSCAEDRRLTDTVGGTATQRRTDDSTRGRLDLVASATKPVDMGVEASSFLRGRNGDQWARLAVVCREDLFADCLAGSALAGTEGPVLFVPGGPNGTLPPVVTDELDRAVRTGGRVYLLGGSGAVSRSIEDGLRSGLAGREVLRLSGPNRYATAVRIADEVQRVRNEATESGIGRIGVSRALPVALLARSDNPTDAVVAGSFAGRFRVPILLTEPGRLPSDTQAWLSNHRGAVAAIGGRAAVSDGVFAQVDRLASSTVRVSGPDRHSTSVAIASHPALWDQQDLSGTSGILGLVGTATRTWNVALAAAPIGASLGMPLVYTTVDDLPEVVRGHLRDRRVAGRLDLTTGFLGGGLTSGNLVERFHATVLPGLGGNVDVGSS